ncbi:MAG: type I DNA topoisomerase [Fusobacteriaceae bacterium]
MSKKKLVIVESPAKAKTIEKILGDSYYVTASFGHVRDLPKTTLGIKIEENFKPNYSILKDKKELVNNLKAMAKKSSKVYLASDPDREGEAIAWHIAKALKLDENELNRIEFNEITQSAVGDSIKNVRKIDMEMVNAQQARRILDRIVGYKISPMLWRTISANTSAGRVQSVALKLICDLEDIIKIFVPERYWTVGGEFQNNLELSLNKVDGEKFTLLKDESIVLELEKIKKNSEFKVTTSKVTRRTKNPPQPLKTSTLQQLSSSYLGFSATKTMRVAQGLYEGLTINGEQQGLITYMRTDSVRISEEAKTMAKEFIINAYGIEYIGTEKTSKTKQKIQDAHEAVRPSDVNLEPEKIKKWLDNDQFKLYKLIWDRFVISQMASMNYDQFEVVLNKERFDFRGSLNKIIFDGYYKIFKDEEELPLGDFPDINIGDIKKIKKMNIKEEYTKPPARLTESSLVKRLEQEGIGRPSTYASIVETLKKRDYVALEGKSFVPTELGYSVEKELQTHFPNVMNIKFTAELENRLDMIASGELVWTEVLDEFYGELSIYLEKYQAILDEEEKRRITSDVICECSHGPMVMKTGIFGKYLICENEECKTKITLKGVDLSKEQLLNGHLLIKEQIDARNKIRNGKPTDVYTETGSKCLLKLGRFGSYLESENFKEDEIRLSLPGEIKKHIINGTLEEKNGISLIKDMLDKILEEENTILKSAGLCEKCGSPFKINRGRWGKFLSCTGYPQCKNIKKLDSSGNIVESSNKDKVEEEKPSKKIVKKKNIKSTVKVEKSKEKNKGK